MHFIYIHFICFLLAQILTHCIYLTEKDQESPLETKLQAPAAAVPPGE